MRDKMASPDKIEILFREYFRPLTVFAMQYVKIQPLAEDIVQDLFVYLYERKDTMPESDFPTNYLYTLVRYRCLNNLAHQKIKNKHNSEIHKGLHSNPHDPMELVELIDLEHKYLQSLESLTPACRKVFEMSRMKGKNNLKIANELNLSRRTVETHISNALKILKKQLSKYLPLVVLIFCFGKLLITYYSIVNCYIIN